MHGNLCVLIFSKHSTVMYSMYLSMLAINEVVCWFSLLV